MLVCLISFQLTGAAKEFDDAKPHIHSILMNRYASSLVGDACFCGVLGAKRTTRCSECKFNDPMCAECFIHSHRTEPTHWADVWDFDRGFFIRHDISQLKPDGQAIYFGHNGFPCPKYSPESSDLTFDLIDVNGIHNTRVRFCECSLEDKATQLLKSGLFPATFSQPRMAFTFQVLDHFHKLHLQSKLSTYDYVATLRRLTDNAFAQRVTVCFFLFNQFRY